MWSKRYRSVVLVDLSAFGRPVRLRWRKRRWTCPNPGCAMGSFIEQDPAIGGSSEMRCFYDVPLRSHPLRAANPAPEWRDRPTDPHKGNPQARFQSGRTRPPVQGATPIIAGSPKGKSRSIMSGFQ